MEIYNKNSKRIKEEHLGGKKSFKSKEFSKLLETYSDKSRKEYNA
jgi:hypothetical protein